MWLRISKEVIINTDIATVLKVIDEDTFPKLIISFGEVDYIYEGNVEETLRKIMFSDDKQFWAGK